MSFIKELYSKLKIGKYIIFKNYDGVVPTTSGETAIYSNSNGDIILNDNKISTIDPPTYQIDGSPNDYRENVNFVGFNSYDNVTGSTLNIINPLQGFSNSIYVDEQGDDISGNGSAANPYKNISKALTETNDIITITGDTTLDSNVITLADTTGIVIGSKVKGLGISNFSIVIDIVVNVSITISADATASAVGINLYFLDETLIVVSGKHTIDYNCWKDGVSFQFGKKSILTSTTADPFTNGADYYYGINIYGDLEFVNLSGRFIYYNSSYHPEVECYNVIEFKTVRTSHVSFYMRGLSGGYRHFTKITGNVISNTYCFYINQPHNISIKSEYVESLEGTAIYSAFSSGTGYAQEYNITKIKSPTYTIQGSPGTTGSIVANIGFTDGDISITVTNSGIVKLSAINMYKTLYVGGELEGNVFFKGSMIVNWSSATGTVESSIGTTVNSGSVKLRGNHRYNQIVIYTTVNDGVVVIEDMNASKTEYLTVNGGKVILNCRIKKNSGNNAQVLVSGGELWIYNEIITSYSTASISTVSQTGGIIRLLNGGRVKNTLPLGVAINSTDGEIIVNGGEVYTDNGNDIRFPYNSTSNIQILSGGLTSNKGNVLSGQQKDWVITVSSAVQTDLRIYDIDGYTDFSETDVSINAIVALLVASINVSANKYTAIDNLDGTFNVFGIDIDTFYPINVTNLVNCVSEVITYESIPKTNNISGLTTYNSPVIKIDGVENGYKQNVNFVNFKIDNEEDTLNITNPLQGFSNAIYVDEQGSDIDGNGSIANPYATISKALTETNDIITITGDTTLDSDVITLADTTGIVIGSKVKGLGIPDHAIVLEIVVDTSITISLEATITDTGVSLYILDETLIVINGEHTVDYNCWKDGVSFYFTTNSKVNTLFIAPSNYMFFVTSIYYFNINIYGDLTLYADGGLMLYNWFVIPFNCYNTFEFNTIYGNTGFGGICANNSKNNYLKIRGNISTKNICISFSNYIGFDYEGLYLHSTENIAIKTSYSGGSYVPIRVKTSNISGSPTHYSADIGTSLYGSAELDLGITQGDINIYANYNSNINVNAVNVNRTIYVNGNGTGSVKFTGQMRVDWSNTTGIAEHTGYALVNSGSVEIKSVTRYTSTSSIIIITGGVAIIDQMVGSANELINVQGGKAILNCRIKCNSYNGYPINISGGEVWIYNEVDCINLNPLKKIIAVYQTGGIINLVSGGRLISRKDEIGAAGIRSTGGEIIINGGEILNDYPDKALDVEFPYGSTTNMKILSGGLTSKRNDVLSGQQKAWTVTVSSGIQTDLRINDIDGYTDFSETDSTEIAIAALLVASINASNNKYTAIDNLDGTFEVIGTDIDTFYPVNITSLVNCTEEILQEESIPKINDVDDLTIYNSTSEFVSSSGSTIYNSATYDKELSINPLYYVDDSLKQMKYEYVHDNSKYYEERFEYTDSIVSKIEIKDDMNNTWIEKTNIYNGSGLLQKPTVTTITDWTITV